MRGAVLTLSIVCAAGLAVAAPAAGSGRTVVHHFQAFSDGKIAPRVQVASRAPGYCWETSGVESRRYAWRCFKGNYILDPCFSSTRQSRFVLCPTEPWSEDVVRLLLTRRLPRWQHYAYRQSRPVGLWTTTGKRCVHSSGATSDIEGKPITYVCRGGGVLVGLARRATPVWTVWWAPSFKAKHLTRVGLTDAWW
ncbi:MAG TPA: hypothetical protein VH541_06965 [Gaiellaceae bacterium]|jgi:hypothetical protein